MPVVVDDEASVSSATRHRASPAKNWSFTWNNYPPNWQELILAAFPSSVVKVFVIQQETGEEGTPHLQGCVELQTKKRAFSLGLPPSLHWEVTKKPLAARLYCSKEDTRDEGATPFTFGWRPPRSLRLITELRPWQRQLRDTLLEDPDDRTIRWYWEATGNTGKTAFTKYMMHTHQAMLLSGKGADVLNAIVTHHKETQQWPDIVIYDVPRSVDMAYLSWSSLEKIKDGCFYSGKYEGGWCLMAPPHLVVFANEPPPIEKLSADRWKVVQVPANP